MIPRTNNIHTNLTYFLEECVAENAVSPKHLDFFRNILVNTTSAGLESGKSCRRRAPLRRNYADIPCRFGRCRFGSYVFSPFWHRKIQFFV